MTLAPTFSRAAGSVAAISGASGVADKWSNVNLSSRGRRTLIRLTRTSTAEKPASVARRCSSSLVGTCRGAKLQGSCVADKSSERFADRAVVKPDTVPDAEREAAATGEHTAHLPHCKRL